METLAQTSDQELYFLCKKYGEIALRYRNKFAGLLPEVCRRRLYEKKGFSSIFEFAAKLAGMSEEHVRRVLNLEKRFENLPLLKGMLIDGEVSVSKLAKIASIATLDSQDFLANQIKLLSHSALETLVRDKRYEAKSPEFLEQNGLLAAKTEAEFVRANINPPQKSRNASAQDLQLSPEVRQKLLELQNRNIDINVFILNALSERELKIAQAKERLALESEKTPIATNGELKARSRHIPTEIKNLLKQEFGDKCSVPYCHHPSETIHHTRRFALSQNHNPYFLAPLCEEHHAIAHSIDQKYVSRKLASSS